MKELLKFIIKKITGSDDFTIKENVEDDNVTLEIVAKPENIGLIIGKGGGTIKAIQNVLRVKGRLEKQNVYVSVSEAASSPK